MPHRILYPPLLALTLGCITSLAMCLAVRADSGSAAPADGQAERWWEQPAVAPILDSPEWVSFELQAIIMDTLAHNPRILAVNHRSAVAAERIVQEDAVFDPALLLESKYGSTSDPVGNTLTTGGPPRLQQDSWDNSAGVKKTARDGTRIDVNQQLGLLDSNSLFFAPNDQGNTRLNLSVTKPLMSGAGRAYNERLIVQARIDSNISIQQMQQEVQERLATSIKLYWQIYQLRCQLVQQKSLLARGLEVQSVISGRRGFDSGELEDAKVATRVAKRQDLVIELERNLKNLQTQLSAVVGSEALKPGRSLELIPTTAPSCIPLEVDLRAAVVEALSHRAEIRSAALNLEAASLAISVTRNELLPQLNAVAGGYLAALNPEFGLGRSLGDQFTDRPGFNGGLSYELPYARRAARSRHRAAHQTYLEMSERYREAIATTQAEVETAWRNLDAAQRRLETRRQIWAAAVKQESLVRCRWESLGPDGRYAAIVLEDLLDQQDGRTLAESQVVASEVEFILALVDLQTAMGTLLTAEGPSAAHPPVSATSQTISPESTVGPNGLLLPAVTAEPAATSLLNMPLNMPPSSAVDAGSRTQNTNTVPFKDEWMIESETPP